MSPVSVTAYSDQQQRCALRSLDTLDRLDARLEAHYAAKRRHPRKTFRGTATIRIPSSDAGSPVEFTVWTRSISASGLSFICPDQIPEPWVLVGLPTGGEPAWFFADIVRRREIAEEGFWEHGVAFRGRVQD